MLKFSPTTIVRFFAKTTAYVKGEGQAVSWEDLGVLYGEWRGTYGDRVTAAQALGVNDSATFRTFYHPAIYAKLRTVQVVAIKNDDPAAIQNGAPVINHPSAYELWAGVDNVGEANRHMEMRLRRYEGK